MRLLTAPKSKQTNKQTKPREPCHGRKAAAVRRCFGGGTHALGLGKPMDSSTSRLELHLMEPGRLCRSLRGRILL